MNKDYLASLPERAIRAIAAGIGGFVYETTEILLPDWFRRSRVYQAIAGRLLRITVEGVGDVAGVFSPDEIDIASLAKQKAAGNVIEMTSLLAVGWSPLWLLAAAADLTGGTRVYLQALVSELQHEGVLTDETNIDSIEELLSAVEDASALTADIVDVPPLSADRLNMNVHAMHKSWQALKENIAALPDASRQAKIYTQLQDVAKREGHSLWVISSMIGAGAARAGMKLGQTYLFDYYNEALRAIAAEGLTVYAQRTSRPYINAIIGHFSPARRTYSERLLQRVQRWRRILPTTVTHKETSQ